jgi:hypothetical protein
MNSLLLFAVIAAAAASGGEATIGTLDGRALKGEISAWTAAGLTFSNADGDTKIPAGEVLEVRWSREAADGAGAGAMYIEMIDGSRIAYAEVSIAKRQATVTGGLLRRPLRIPRDSIRLIELRPVTPFIASALEEIERKEIPGDALVVSQRESETMDYLPGVIGDVTAEQAGFDWDGERVEVKRSKIAAMVFYQARQAVLPDTSCELSLTDGSRLAAREISLEGKQLSVTTPAGARLDVSLEQLVRADFSSGKIAYLSDLTPSGVRWTPGLGVPKAELFAEKNLPRRDVSFSGSPLSLVWNDNAARSRRDVRTYAKGLALRSRTEVTYRLPQGMKRFSATAGLDPESRGGGHLLLLIRGDERVLWEGPIDGAQPPVEIDVELGAARRLHLVVDYGEHLDFGDRLHLVEARVTK